MVKLSNRAIIEIKGPDRKTFLQGLITNDVNKVGEALVYATMLNAQGRFLYDFFIFEQNETLFIDCDKNRRSEIIKKFGFYKLRSKVEIKENNELLVFSVENDGENSFLDPRNSSLDFRAYLKQGEDGDLAKYHLNRIKNKVAQSEDDLTYEKSFIAEFGFDDLNAIDYTKGCYVGQEPTARIHHLGEIRKKIFYIEIDNLKNIEKNSKITCEGKSIGIVLSSIYSDSKLHSLALLKLQDLNKEKLEFEGNKITINS